MVNGVKAAEAKTAGGKMGADATADGRTGFPSRQLRLPFAESVFEDRPPTTNVKPGDLNYDRYAPEQYDRDIQGSIPGHRELHREIESFAKKELSGKQVRILELGVGTGITAECVLKLLPGAGYTAFDFSENMLKGAIKRLAAYNAMFIQDDYAKAEFPGKFNVIVSVIGIHHQTHEGKLALFKKISDALEPGGVFIFGDLVTYRDSFKAALNDALHYSHLVANARDEKSLQEWAHHHKFLNLPAPLEDQLAWLKEAGFKSIEVAFQKFNTVLVFARR